MFNLKIFQNSAFDDAFSILIFTIVNIIFLVLFYFVTAKERKIHKGFKDFIIGSLMQITSIIILSFLYLINVAWLKSSIMFLANISLSLSYFVICQAFSKLMNKKTNLRITLIPITATIIIYFYATLTNIQVEVFSIVTLIILFSMNIFIIIRGDLIRRIKEEKLRWLQYIVINSSALFLILIYFIYLVVLSENTIGTILLHNGDSFIFKSVIIMGTANVIALSMTYNSLIMNYERIEKDVFIELFHNAPFIVLVIDSPELKLLYANPNFINETGYKRSEVIEKMTIADLKFSDEVNKKIVDSFLTKKELKGVKMKFYNKTGEKIYGDLSTTILEAEKSHYLIINIVNVSDLVISRESYKSLALIDYLTSLPNRRALISNLEGKIKKEKFFTIIMVDLDNFKMINDKYGHGCGDVVLQKVGEKLSFLNNEPNIVSRYGGDEFVILLSQNKKDSQVTINKITEIFQKPFHIKTKVVDIKASIGYAYFPEDGKRIDTLLRKADSILYKTKDNSSNKARRSNTNID